MQALGHLRYVQDCHLILEARRDVAHCETEGACTRQLAQNHLRTGAVLEFLAAQRTRPKLEHLRVRQEEPRTGFQRDGAAAAAHVQNLHIQGRVLSR